MDARIALTVVKTTRVFADWFIALSVVE